ncbi:MAG TPA: hypothetical protein VHD85_15600 [Terracidiphilus sp.]|nr:hypothetical protein [Terracidiphilus sp.]
MFAGISYGFWLGNEHERSPWLAGKPQPWTEGSWFIEIKIPSWMLTLFVGVMAALFPIAFVKNLLSAQLFYPVACLLLLAGNRLAIWLYRSHLHDEEAKDSGTHN